MTIRTATGLIAAYICSTGCRGWTSFLRGIYVLPGYERNERLLRHERKHLEQIERDGRGGVCGEISAVAVSLRVLA